MKSISINLVLGNARTRKPRTPLRPHEGRRWSPGREVVCVRVLMHDEVRWHDGGGDYNHRIAEVDAHSLSISLACVNQAGQHSLHLLSFSSKLDSESVCPTVFNYI